MASSYVFPGGIADEGETDPRTTAIRELFEESGILFTAEETDASSREQWRTRVNVDKANFAETLDGRNLALDSLHEVDVQRFGHNLQIGAELAD